MNSPNGAFAKLGIKVMITELDVSVLPTPGPGGADGAMRIVVPVLRSEDGRDRASLPVRPREELIGRADPLRGAGDGVALDLDTGNALPEALLLRKTARWERRGVAAIQTGEFVGAPHRLGGVVSRRSTVQQRCNPGYGAVRRKNRCGSAPSETGRCIRPFVRTGTLLVHGVQSTGGLRFVLVSTR